MADEPRGRRTRYPGFLLHNCRIDLERHSIPLVVGCNSNRINFSLLTGTEYKSAAGVCLEVLSDRLNEANFCPKRSGLKSLITVLMTGQAFCYCYQFTSCAGFYLQVLEMALGLISVVQYLGRAYSYMDLAIKDKKDEKPEIQHTQREGNSIRFL